MGRGHGLPCYINGHGARQCRTRSPPPRIPDRLTTWSLGLTWLPPKCCRGCPFGVGLDESDRPIGYPITMFFPPPHDLDVFADLDLFVPFSWLGGTHLRLRSCKRRIPSPPKKCRRTESTPRQRKNTPRSPNYSRNSSTSPASTKRGSSSPTMVRSDLSFRCDAFGGGTGGFLMFVPFRLSLCKRSKHLVGHVLGQASRSFGQQEENDDTVFSYLEG
ncbi:hypothetical protein GW17_00046997 [Ensete ventricosum]|nr:hypothetical protein GW17_00046997 [Ensete ventricosum]